MLSSGGSVDDFAFFVDQQHCRNALNSVKIADFRLAGFHRQRFRNELPRYVFFRSNGYDIFVAFIGVIASLPNIRGNNFQSFVFVFFVGTNQTGQFPFAWAAPGCREFDDNVFAAQRIPIEIFIVRRFAEKFQVAADKP